MFDFIPVQYYSTIFYWAIFAICMCVALRYTASPNNQLLLQQQRAVFAYIITISLILYIGLRPISWIFQDMMGYARGFQRINQITDIDWGGECGLYALMLLCKRFGGSVELFFLLVAAIYIAFQVIAGKKLLFENPLLACLFLFSAFSFWGFGTNGLRNGVACSIVLLGIACYIQKNTIPSIILFFIALETHRSTFLPIFMFFIAYYVIQRPKNAIYFWLLSIILSLIGGNTIASLFAELGFDDRMSSYMVLQSDAYYKTGFRWDFLLYSSIPVFLTWYVTEKKGIYDYEFNILSSTYILSNAFWVMVIRAAFSNRFAYLSWFIYPLVIAYALIRLPIWTNQDRKVGWVLLMHSAFTMFMFLIGKLY